VTVCPNCGAPAAPESRFCQKCGTTIPAAAPPSPPARPHAPTQMESPALPVEGYSYQPPPPPPGAGYPPPYPSQTPPPPPGVQPPIYPPPVLPGYTAAPRKSSKAPLIIILVLVVLAGGYAGVAYWKHLWPFAGGGPKEAVEQARDAYNKKDAAKFDKYVDLKSVLADFFDQVGAEGGIDQQSLGQIKFAMPQITEIFKNIFFGTPTSAPPEMVQAMGPGAELMRSGLQKLTYGGIDSQEITGKDALVKVKIVDSSTTPAQTKILELKLKDNGTNWQVVATVNLKKLDPSMLSSPATAGPKEAVEQARAAYQKKDAVLFDKYVDLESVCGDVFDQMAAEGAIDQPTLVQVKANLPKIAEVVKSIFFGTPTDAPPELVQSMTASSQQLRTALEKVSYQGVDSVASEGPSDAIVKVKLADATNGSAKTEIMEVKVKNAGANWKVVAVPNLNKMK
jgi:hypothetical protein